MVFVYSFIKKLDVVFGDVLTDYKVRLQTLPPIHSELGKYMHIASCLSIPCLFLPNRTPNVFEYLCFSHGSWRTVPYPSTRRTSCFNLCSLREYLVLIGKESACQCRRCGFNPWVRTIPWKRKQQPIPVLLPGDSHEQMSLAGYSPWCHKELDMIQ